MNQKSIARVPWTLLEIWIGTVGMARAEAANVKAWSRFSYGDRDESQTFTRINTSHDHYINLNLEHIKKRIKYNEWLNFQLVDSY